MVATLSIIDLSVTSKFWCNKLITISTSFPHTHCQLGQKVLCEVCLRSEQFLQVHSAMRGPGSVPTLHG